METFMTEKDQHADQASHSNATCSADQEKRPLWYVSPEEFAYLAEHGHWPSDDTPRETPEHRRERLKRTAEKQRANDEQQRRKAEERRAAKRRTATPSSARSLPSMPGVLTPTYFPEDKK